MKKTLRRVTTWVRGRTAQLLAGLKRLFDLQDVYVYTGLASLGTGAWMAYPPAGPIVVGAALFWLGLGGPGLPRDSRVNRRERR